jgi:O-antigen/teichoic acid export membrane protein
VNKNKVLKKNISLGLVFKVSTIALSYISVPIVLTYLGEKNYGVWITIFSILSWIYTFDIGIGNGLKIRLSEALTKKDIQSAKEYVSTAYIVIFAISLLLCLICLLAGSVVNITDVINADFKEGNYLNNVVLISFIFVLNNFVLDLYKQLLRATHKSALVDFSGLMFQSIVIISLLIGRVYVDSSLMFLAFIYGASNAITAVIFTVYFFRNNKDILPHLKYISRDKIKDVTGIGASFFVIQICIIVMFTTDNLLVAHFLGPEQVTSYSLVNKIFQPFIFLWYTLSGPLTPLFTTSYHTNDIDWIKLTLKKLNKFLFFLLFGVIGVVLIGNDFLDIWLGKKLDYPPYIFIFFGCFVMMRMYGDLYMSFLNGLGKLNLQVYLSIFGALINIPLSFYFITVLDLHSSGVILATCCSLLLLTIMMPIQAHYVLKRKA